jgi:hypothetical protein
MLPETIRRISERPIMSTEDDDEEESATLKR